MGACNCKHNDIQIDNGSIQNHEGNQGNPTAESAAPTFSRAKAGVNKVDQSAEREEVTPTPVEEFDMDSCFDFHGLSKQIFYVFNDMRINPEQYLGTVNNQRLKETMESVVRIEDRPDHLIWSEKKYSTLYNYLIHHRDFKLTQHLEAEVVEMLNKATGNDFKGKIFEAQCKSDPKEAVLSLLENNHGSSYDLMTTHFQSAVVITLPKNSEWNTFLLITLTARD